MKFIVISILLLAAVTAVAFWFIYHIFRYAVVRSAVSVPTEEELYTGNFKPFEKVLMEGRNWVLSHEDDKVSITSFDGLKLNGFFIPCEKPERTVICVHGFRGSGAKDFGAVAKYYHSIGSNVLVIDHRAHGESEGEYITYGVKERYDVKEWIRFVNDQVGGELPIILDGVSMGAATVLMTSALNLPSNVKGIIADCGFTSPKEIYKDIAKKTYHIPPFPLLFIFNLYCKKIASFDMNEADAREALKENTIPTMFLHGMDDRFVPLRMSEENYACCKAEKYIERIPNAQHAVSYFVDTDYCRKKIMEFIKRAESC